jgi:hypothetical protein
MACRSRQQYSISEFHHAVLSIITMFWGQKLDVYAPTPSAGRTHSTRYIASRGDIPLLEISADFGDSTYINIGAGMPPKT